MLLAHLLTFAHRNQSQGHQISLPVRAAGLDSELVCDVQLKQTLS
jgi:hypothetical protein